MKNVILNSKGEAIQLDPRALAYSARMQAQLDPIQNALGFQIDITTLTTVQAKVIEQTFFTIRPSDYIPVRVGVGAWSDEILTLTSTSLADDFETGIINAASNNSRLAAADAGIDSIRNKVGTWAKEIHWTLAELNFASKFGNWDVVTSKEKARKTNWDLGIQKLAFLGSTSYAGLLNQSGVNINTTLITKPIKNMTDSEFEAFLGGLIPAYRANTQYTAFPDRFYIPESDFTGLGAAVDENFGLKSRLQRMLEAFRLVTMNPNFQILPLAYGSQVNNTLGLNRYVLLNYSDDNVVMDIPVDYTTTVAGTVNGFQYTNVGYGQFAGVQATKPLTIMYFDYAN